MAVINKVNTGAAGDVGSDLANGEIGFDRANNKIYVGDGVATGADSSIAVNSEATDKLSSPIDITLSGDVSGSVNTDLSGNVSMSNTSYNVAATTSVAGKVQLNDTLTSTSTSQALTANAGKSLKDTKRDISDSYSADEVDTTLAAREANRIIDNASRFVSAGYIGRLPKMDNFVFEEDENFTYKVADKGQYLNFGGDVQYTYGENIWDGNDEYILVNQASSTNPISVSHTLEAKSYMVEYTQTLSEGMTGFYSSGSTINAVGDGFGYTENHKVANVFHVDTAGSYTLNVRTAGETSGTINNISVREITTADLTNYMPDVRVETSTSTGATTTADIAVGDYVVPEEFNRVSNGKFDSDLNGWNPESAVWSWSDGTAYGYSLSSAVYMRQYGVLPVSTTITVSFDIVSYGFGTLNVGNTNDSTAFNAISGLGKQEFTFNSGSDTNFEIWTNSGSGCQIYIDNVKVIADGDVILDTAYRAKDWNGDGTVVPLGTAVTNTTYFQARDAVTNQILIAKKSDGTWYYETLFVDVTSTDSAHTALVNNGFSKMSNGMYSKGTDVVTPVAVWNTLNKGAYHPVFNSEGADWIWNVEHTSAKKWYEAYPSGTDSRTSTANLFTHAYGAGYLGSGSVSVHPEVKYYNIIYPDQLIDLRQEALAPNLVDDLQKSRQNAVSGVTEGVKGKTACYGEFNTAETNSTASASAFQVNNTSSIVVGATIVFLTSAGIKFKDIVTGVYSNYVTVENVHQRTSGEVYTSILVSQESNILSSGTSLSTDVIGDPQFYPQAMKDVLASGKPLIGLNPLLVNQDGDVILPDGVTSYKSILSSKSTITSTDIIASSNQGETWSPYATAIGSTNNMLYGASTVLNNNWIYVVPYTSENPTYNQIDPLKVELVDNVVVASNSHSVHKGGKIVSSIGKIPTGNGANGLELVTLYNASRMGYGEHVADTASRAYTVGEIVTYVSPWTTYKGYTVEALVADSFSEANMNSYVEVDGYIQTTGGTKYFKILNVTTTPSHSTIALDSEDSTAGKWFHASCVDSNGEIFEGVVLEEGNPDTTTTNQDGTPTDTLGFGTTFTQLTSGVRTDVNNNVVVTKFLGKPTGKYLKRG